VKKLDEMVAQCFGFSQSYAVTGQTYPRKLDAQVVGSLAGVAASVHKFANDLRLLAGMKQIEEPFEEEQVGSSAMAYKRNPMLCERATGLARFVISLANSPLQTAAEQWLERTLDDSSNKRLTIPEPFLAIDGCLRIIVTVARGMVVYPKTIEAYVNAELPFMATEEILMAAVAAGASRQDAHEIIRRHSLAAAEQIKIHGRPNDLLDRLRTDSTFSNVNMGKIIAPSAYVGRAPEQTEEFIQSVVTPIRERYVSALNRSSEMKV
jgi:adenylosuccinate lyase